ncbi:MAG: hypothetical protein IJ830_03985, partial [Alphaproteobacteria bacterium]|nr:hypothetical protein [Alphaproteobacteria bacterium]
QSCCGAKACPNNIYSSNTCNNTCSASQTCDNSSGNSDCPFLCKTTCEGKTCDPAKYPYLESGLPNHSSPLSGSDNECTPINVNTCTAEEKRYKDFVCNTSEGYTRSGNTCVCNPQCPSEWYTYENRPAKQADCQTYDTKTASETCGSITCYKLNSSKCRTSCEEYEYDVTFSEDTVYSCDEEATFNNDLGDEITCGKGHCSVCPDADAFCTSDWLDTYQHGNFQTLVTYTVGQKCPDVTCYCKQSTCSDAGLSSTKTGDYTISVTSYTCGIARTCYAKATCSDYGYQSSYSSTYNTPVTVNIGSSTITCYKKGSSSSGGGGGGGGGKYWGCGMSMDIYIDGVRYGC